MEIKEKLQEAYIDYILHHGEQPKTVYLFAKQNGLDEEEFYNYYGSFESIEQIVWQQFITDAISEVKRQEVWHQYTTREKALSFFYSFIEFLKSKRSFSTFSLKQAQNGSQAREKLNLLKTVFDEFSSEIIQEGLESGELMDRPFFAARYNDALWIKLVFILNFWAKDTSAGFEKTDEAIEKGINVLFNLFQRSPVDDLVDYGKFLLRNSGNRMPF